MDGRKEASRYEYPVDVFRSILKTLEEIRGIIILANQDN